MERSSEDNNIPDRSATACPNPTMDPSAELKHTAGVKKEEPEDHRIDPTIAIFDDVDGDTTDDESELVDDSHVGYVEHNGVNCWVCPGMFIELFLTARPILTYKGFRIPQIPQVVVVKRPLQDLYGIYSFATAEYKCAN